VIDLAKYRAAADIREGLREMDAWEKSRLRWLLQTANHPDPTKRRPNQLTPGGDWWNVALWLAGRGYGKTRIGSEDVADYCRTHRDVRYAGVFETFADGRDVVVEGESGILRSVPPSAIVDWNRSLGELIFTTGSRFDIYSGQKPDALRGPQHHRAWVDEPAKFRYLTDTWNNLQFGLRLGEHPQCLVTGTPKPIALIRDLLLRENPHRDHRTGEHVKADVTVIRGSTMENAHNLADSAIEQWIRLYAGTPLYDQEILGIVLDDYPGALWTRDNIRLNSLLGAPVPPLVEIAIGVDPSAYSPELSTLIDADLGALGGRGKETGIITVGKDAQDPPHIYVLADRSGRYKAEDYGKIVVDEYYRWADQGIPTKVVPEVNLNGPAVLAVVRLSDQARGEVRFHTENGRPGVRASDSKRARAEAPSAVYAQDRAHHVGSFPELEDTLVTWDPNENWSPDRMDALVWAIYGLEPWGVPANVGTSFDEFVDYLSMEIPAPR